MMKNSYKLGTKSHKVIELLNAGKTYDEIRETMAYKDNNPISGIVSRCKQRNLFHEQMKTTPPPPPEILESSPPGTPIITMLPPGGPPQKRMDDMGKNVVQIEGFAPSRYIALTPKNITLIQWFTAKFGYTGDLSDFINDAIEDFFRSRKYQLKVIKEEIII